MAKSFIEKYKASYGDLGPYSIYAYDAANILLTAIKETRSVDGAQLAAYISATPFRGALGTISFDGRGDVTRAPYVVWQVKGGTFMQIR